jgi:hypothetical protein
MEARTEVTPYGLSRSQLTLECIRLALSVLNPPAMVGEAGKSYYLRTRSEHPSLPLVVLVGSLIWTGEQLLQLPPFRGAQPDVVKDCVMVLFRAACHAWDHGLAGMRSATPDAPAAPAALNLSDLTSLFVAIQNALEEHLKECAS